MSNQSGNRLSFLSNRSNLINQNSSRVHSQINKSAVSKFERESEGDIIDNEKQGSGILRREQTKSYEQLLKLNFVLLKEIRKLKYIFILYIEKRTRHTRISFAI